MSEAATPSPRPRRWWLAFLLNLILAPAGYAYLGAWRTMAAVVVLLLAGAFAAMYWTVLSPPGVYALGLNGVLVFAGLLAMAVATHAAVMAGRSAPRSGSRLLHAATYVGIGLGTSACAQLVRAYQPYAAYQMSSASMSPTMEEGDVLVARGARAQCGREGFAAGHIVLAREDGVMHVRRAVAGPGETVAMQSGVLTIDGRPVSRRDAGRVAVPGLPGATAQVFIETLANGVSYTTLDFGPDGDLDNVAPFVVPAGSWYLLGDSRDNSADSRIKGPIPAKDVCAVGLKIVFSKDKSRVGQAL